MIEWSKFYWHLSHTNTCTWFLFYLVFVSLFSIIFQFFFFFCWFTKLTRVWFNGQVFNWIKSLCVDGWMDGLVWLCVVCNSNMQEIPDRITFSRFFFFAELLSARDFSLSLSLFLFVVYHYCYSFVSMFIKSLCRPRKQQYIIE